VQLAQGGELLEALFEPEDAAFDAAGAGAVCGAEGVGAGVEVVF
jgi:hypothetical protein